MVVVVLRAGGTSKSSKPKVQIFSLILTCSSLTLRTWQGKWVFILFFFFFFKAQHSLDTKGMFSHGRAEEAAKDRGSGLEMITVAG